MLSLPHADWTMLLAASGLAADRVERLLARDIDALDALARELNELRTIGR